MAKAKSDIELDDDEDFVEEDDTPDTDSAPNTRNSLTKRRLIDNYLEERRLQKQLSDFDFDCFLRPIASSRTRGDARLPLAIAAIQQIRFPVVLATSNLTTFNNDSHLMFVGASHDQNHHLRLHALFYRLRRGLPDDREHPRGRRRGTG